MTVADDVRARVADLPCLGPDQAAELARIVQRLVEALQPERIYVFGSQARGDAGPDSDVDLMLVVPSSSQPRYRRGQQAYRAIGWHRVPVDLLVLTREEFERYLESMASLPATIRREGRLLYAA